MNIVLIAPPAAGKGTLSGILSSRYNIPHISTGELLRERSIVNDDLGNSLHNMMKSGKLVSDSIVINILKERLKNNDCNNGYILDGFPRNIYQAESLDEILNEIKLPIDYAVYLDIDKEEGLKRITGRMSCPKCGTIYNKYNKARSPIVDGVCDKCCCSLITRADDNVQTYVERYDSYMESTVPVIDFYKNQGKLLEFDGRLESEKIADMVIDLMR